MSTGTGVNVSKANVYAVAGADSGVNVSKANVYAVAGADSGVVVSKINVYAVIVGVPPGINVTKANIYAVIKNYYSTNQVIGGVFMDSLGNPLANGYLIFELSSDETVNTTTECVCSGLTIKIPLDSGGSIVSSPPYYLWPNDIISPSGSFYVVSAYTADGELVWGPNKQTITKSPSPFNVNTWIP